MVSFLTAEKHGDSARSLDQKNKQTYQDIQSENPDELYPDIQSGQYSVEKPGWYNLVAE